MPVNTLFSDCLVCEKSGFAINLRKTDEYDRKRPSVRVVFLCIMGHNNLPFVSVILIGIDISIPIRIKVYKLCSRIARHNRLFLCFACITDRTANAVRPLLHCPSGQLPMVWHKELCILSFKLFLKNRVSLCQNHFFTSKLLYLSVFSPMVDLTHWRKL